MKTSINNVALLYNYTLRQLHGHFPSQYAANFKTRLATPISLVGEWDVALYEIHYKRLWYTIQAVDAEIGYEVKRAEGETITYRTFFYQGYYASIEDIVSTLNVIYGRLKNHDEVGACAYILV